jgi:hypothetical protein
MEQVITQPIGVVAVAQVQVWDRFQPSHQMLRGGGYISSGKKGKIPALPLQYLDFTLFYLPKYREFLGNSSGISGASQEFLATP